MTTVQETPAVSNRIHISSLACLRAGQLPLHNPHINHQSSHSQTFIKQ